MTRRLERDLLAAGERIVRVPPKLMAMLATQPAPTANPITRRPCRCSHRTARTACPPRTSTAPIATCGCWSTAAKTSSPNAQAPSTDSAGICTKSIQMGPIVAIPGPRQQPGPHPAPPKHLEFMSMNRCNALGDHPEGSASGVSRRGVPRSGAASIAGSALLAGCVQRSSRPRSRLGQYSGAPSFAWRAHVAP